MRSFLVIVLTKLPAEQRHVRLSEDDEMVEAFLLDCLNESLHKCDGVRGSNGGPPSLDVAIREDVQEWLRILAIVVVHQEIAGDTLRFRVPDKGLSLLDHPFPIRLVRMNDGRQVIQCGPQGYLIRKKLELLEHELEHDPYEPEEVRAVVRSIMATDSRWVRSFRNPS